MAIRNPSDYIDLARYPIDDPGAENCRAMIEKILSGLGRGGCAVLKGFVRGERIAELVAEANRVAPAAHRSFNRTNAYFTKDVFAAEQAAPAG